MARKATDAQSTLLKGFIFAIPLLAGFVAMECGLRRVVTRASHARARIEAQQGRCQVLVLGASNAKDGIAVEALGEPAVNLADDAQSLYYDLALAEQYVPRMPKLKVVILPLTYVTFETEGYDWEGWTSWSDYADYWNIPSQKASFFEAQRWSLTARYGVRMSISYARKKFRVNLEKSARKVLNAEENAAAAARLAKDHGKAIHPERAGDNLARLDRLTALVQHDGATLVLVEMPTQENYLRLLSRSVKDRNRDNRLKFLQRHPNVIYRDYVHDGRFGGSDFRDPVHLNPQGAEKFSKILDAEVVPLVQSRP